MIRTFLAVGDKAGDAVITEGLPNCWHKEENGSKVRLATVGMKTYCHARRKTGSITASGPRRPGTAWNGKDWALSGDINICDCDPAPVFSAQRNMTMLLTSEEIARSSVPYGRAVPASSVLRAVPGYGNLPGDMSLVTTPNSGAQHDCSYLDGTKNRIDAPAGFYKRTNKITVAPGKLIEFNFPGVGVSKATRYDTTVNGKVIPIYIPSQAPPQDTALVNQVKIAKALEVLPAQHLENIGKVSANPVRNPADDYWIKRYGDDTFASAATANIEQGITFYPWKSWSTIPQRFIDSTMLHETGHQVSEALWKDSKLKKDWLNAMASDGKPPSQYARSNENEDFAETANMYWSSKGTPCEAEGRRRYPARYAYFDKISE